MKNFFYLAFLFLFFGCSKTENHPYTFYYWKTKLTLDEIEKKALEKATDNVLYTRFFDVDKVEGKFQPVATLTKDESFKTSKQIVPVIFVTNRSFLYITKKEITFLAQSVSNLIEKKTNELHLKASSEIQIDCDWTQGTRNDYFQFLSELKRLTKKNITSTLRLHQVKDKEKMGIPPVEKVYLMCYSTSSPLENSDKNSILDLPLAKNYLADLEEYPIKKIDVALPIYSWGIITNHLGKHKLINALNSKDLENKNFRKISETEAEVLKDGFYFGFFMNKGFHIKVEEIPEKQLDLMVDFLQKKITNFNIVYYQLDTQFLGRHSFNH